jgi:hypothetical protein
LTTYGARIYAHAAFKTSIFSGSMDKKKRPPEGSLVEIASMKVQAIPKIVVDHQDSTFTNIFQHVISINKSFNGVE